MNMNRFLCEKVMGKCWHEALFVGGVFPECSCGKKFNNKRKLEAHIKRHNPDYSKNPADYFALLMKARESEWWFDFLVYCDVLIYERKWIANNMKKVLAPENLARLIAEYHG